MLPGFYLRSLPPSTILCIFGNVIQNYPVGWRFTDFNLTIMTSCPAPGQVVGFPDALRFMRFIALNNGCQRPDINGTVCFNASLVLSACFLFPCGVFVDLCYRAGVWRISLRIELRREAGRSSVRMRTVQ